MRFQMKIDPVWRPFVLVGGATKENSYVEVTDDEVSFNYGMLFRRTVPRSEIKDSRPRDWPWWMGIGWRSNLRDLVGLVGSYDGVVEVELEEPFRAWRLLPTKRIAVSLEDPEGFLSALNGGSAKAASKSSGEKPAPKRRSARRKTTRRSTPKAKPSDQG